MPDTSTAPLLPLVITPDQLDAHRHSKRVVMIDVPAQPRRYMQGHIPGAYVLDYTRLLSGQAPTPAGMPEASVIAALLSRLGITSDTHVVAYDDEGGGCASRLLWTLALVGHSHYSLLDGGLHAWSADQKPMTTSPSLPTSTHYILGPQNRSVATNADALLASPNTFTIWDARSAEEYRGEVGHTPRLGHIPGAINLDWRQLFNPHNAYRLHPKEELRALLTHHGLTPDRHIVAHCQSHHRSSLAWFVGHYLGYPHISAYPGAWLEWGSRTDTPITH